jgi:K+-transporting ATPase KdpF subunit
MRAGGLRECSFASGGGEADPLLALDGGNRCSTRCWLALGSPFSWRPFSTRSHAIGCEGAMIFDLVLGGIATLAITAYLVYALIRPERF